MCSGANEKLGMVAILLAAGVGKRLSPAHQGPKVLLDFDGRSLLVRSIEALYRYGVRRLTITVGFEAAEIHKAVAALMASDRLAGLVVTFVYNATYEAGSLISLHCQSAILRQQEPVLLLDGDVLYDPALIGRLLEGEREGVLLVDKEIEPGDEPVKICFDAEGIIVDFGKLPTHEYARFGESVGFFRFSGDLAAELADRCASYVTQGLLNTEYEDAIRDLILAGPERFGAMEVSDLAWTEIDFPEDVIKAREFVLPLVKD